MGVRSRHCNHRQEWSFPTYSGDLANPSIIELFTVAQIFDQTLKATRTDGSKFQSQSFKFGFEV